MSPGPTHFRDEFWRNPPPLPRGVKLVQQEAVVVPRVGPRGASLYDLAEVQLPESRVPVLLGYRAPLFPADVLSQREKLSALREQLQRRDADPRSLPAFRLPMLVTDSASASVIDLCEREEVGLIDMRGTFFLRTGSTFIRVQGHRPLERTPREPLFHGKGCRLVRVLLQSSDRRWTIRALSEQTQTSLLLCARGHDETPQGRLRRRRPQRRLPASGSGVTASGMADERQADSLHPGRIQRSIHDPGVAQQGSCVADLPGHPLDLHTGERPTLR
ncbi:hypothetical protein COCOR_07704 [Corallococcus coralloides DSM 2259]|uniref:Uncharacterized protein n=1 Tax=Corallococcus coralloides (strain ATCC 25202 / DSM 2259 / NBRC 100086 / M2) TaxID=1144275 RepID=H8MT57_CORCM|nr:hypothetical protein COCOR_07704 [Corallococcus coralloides DSM 2259]